MSYSENLADFAYRERDEFIKILQLWQRDGLPENFYEGGVRVAMNANSGHVFLTNEDYQCCMRNGDTLEMWYTLLNLRCSRSLEEKTYSKEELLRYTLVPFLQIKPLPSRIGQRR